MTVDEICSQALQLPIEERELLAVKLFDSLATSEVQQAVEAAWAEEISARSDAYHSGQTETFDARESLERIRSKLAARNAS